MKKIALIIMVTAIILGVCLMNYNAFAEYVVEDTHTADCIYVPADEGTHFVSDPQVNTCTAKVPPPVIFHVNLPGLFQDNLGCNESENDMDTGPPFTVSIFATVYITQIER